MLPMDASLKAPVVQDSYLDQQGLNSIKALGRDKDPQALKEVAKKFEAMFVQQMLKTMRDANDVFAEDSYFNSQESRFHRDMMDQQLVLNLTSGAGIGLATQFYQQMSQAYGQPEAADKTPSELKGELATPFKYQTEPDKSAMIHAASAPSALDEWMNAYVNNTNSHALDAKTTTDAIDAQTLAIPPLLLKPALQMPRTPATSTKAGIAESPEHFVALLKPHAEKAAKELNINPEVLIAQVALETGWGKHVIHHKNGENSFNLFNIKAGRSWQGEKVNVSTLEYQGGVAAIEKADFRKYNDYSESFSDYVRLMKNSPRYQEVLQTGKDSAAYAEALQSAGYATDPAYASKIKQLLNSDVIRDLRKLTQDVSANSNRLLSMAASARQTLME